LKFVIPKRGLIARGTRCLPDEQQVPHRAFSPIRNDNNEIGSN